jgi:hypothetical protein
LIRKTPGIHKLAAHRNRSLVLGLLLIPALLIIMRGWNGFAYPSPESPYSDLTLSHFTFINYVRQQLFENQIFPMWFPTILSGTPLVANPLAGVWYPFGWPAFILPLPFAFNLLVGLHLGWGALGMYLFLRQQRLGIAAALFGGLAFGLMPKLFAHYGAGHLTLMYALPWTPWLLFSTKLDNKYQPLLSAMILALIFLADVRWAVYAGIIWLAWLVVQTDYQISTNMRLKIRYIFIFISLAVLLSACLAIPMLEYSSLSTRADLTGEENFQYSLTFPGLLGIFYPPLQGSTQESILYYSAVVFLLSLLALFWIRINRHVQFWSVVALTALIFSLGSNLPFLVPISYLPVFNLLRVPTRTLFLLGVALAALAAISLDHAKIIQTKPYRRLANLLTTGISAFVGFLTIFILAFIVPNDISPFIWGLLAVLATVLVLGLWVNSKISYNILVIGIFSLLILDAGLAGQTTVSYRSKESVWSEDEAIALYLARDPDQFRVYSPSFSLLQHVAGSHDLELVEGVDPLQLREYVSFMKSATGIPWEGYRVIVPGIAPGEGEKGVYKPDPEKLGLLNVKYILTDYNLPDIEGLSLIEKVNDTRIYENHKVRPRAWSIATEPGGAPTEYPAERIRLSPNQITLTARGPGQLFLSEIAYPGWQATIDGEDIEIHTADGILRSVDLHNIHQQVVFEFRPVSFYLGLIISFTAWIMVLIFLFKSRNSLLGLK